MNRLKSLAAAACLLTALAPPAEAENTPIMPFDQVRIGMKGYGLTVFHGTTIEPFAVEVVSVISDSTPKRGTIWVRCPDERMQKSGPVQGMSGSPIYLWDEGEQGELGEGGRLIGAFAFGYRLTKDCLVGVQPIELMRDIVQRKDEPAHEAQGRSWDRARTALARLAGLAEQRGAPPHHHWRLDLLRGVTGDGPAPRPLIDRDDPHAPQPLLLPLNVGSDVLARALGPLYEPMGLAPVAGDTLAGKPPAGVDAEAVKLEPGSVLSVPLVFGDSDLAAAGTVTDVLDDGTVLGFGHAMFAQGAAGLPMATGYVHFIVPSVDVSFKRTGSLNMAGSLVRDEQTGVLGVDRRAYTTAPIDVTVQHVDGRSESYHYEMVNYRPLSAQLGATVILRSILARQDLPLDCTVDLSTSMVFDGDREIAFDLTLPGANVVSPIYEMLPALILMTNNPFDPLGIQSIEANIVVRPGVEAAQIVAARLEHTEVAPGATVKATVTVQPQDAPPRTLHGQITIPLDTPEGDYFLMIGGGQLYGQLQITTHPHRMQVYNVDQLADLLRDLTSIPNQGLYLMMLREDGGVAVGRTELTQVPSSQVALLTSPTHNYTTPFGRLITSRTDTDLTILGQAQFQISVRQGAFGSSQDQEE